MVFDAGTRPNQYVRPPLVRKSLKNTHTNMSFSKSNDIGGDDVRAQGTKIRVFLFTIAGCTHSQKEGGGGMSRMPTKYLLDQEDDVATLACNYFYSSDKSWLYQTLTEQRFSFCPSSAKEQNRTWTSVFHELAACHSVLPKSTTVSS